MPLQDNLASGVTCSIKKEKLIKFKTFALLMLAVLCLAVVAGCGKETGNLRVSVVDSSGNALWGAKVVSEEQPEGQLKIDGLTSEEAGGVVFNGIKPGKYQLQISRYGFAPEIIEVTVKGGRTESVTVKLFYASPPPVT